jgi:hypothetical protein
LILVPPDIAQLHVWAVRIYGAGRSAGTV